MAGFECIDRGDLLTGPKTNSPGDHTVQAFRKDQKLDHLAERFNVAQFISFAPTSTGPSQQYSRLAGVTPNTQFASLGDALEALFSRSSEGTINIRSFSETQAQSREFIYGVRSVAEAAVAIRRMSSENAFTIANETIDVSDGGVSGVAMGGLVEFRPDDTPRGVEKPGFASLPLNWANSIFKTVYGFDPGLSASLRARVEFSLHPQPRGWRKSHVIFWEYGEDEYVGRTHHTTWPNDFSRMIGDKVYGLLIANVSGLPVPMTTVINRRIAPFSFGRDTGSAERWIRTSPIVQVPGKFTTAKGWLDPFRLMQEEDPDGTNLASVLAQQSVDARYSGAAIESSDGELIIEGAEGSGEGFMLGQVAPQILPDEVDGAVRQTHKRLQTALGSVRFEWVYDGREVWVVQLHTGASQSAGQIIVPGDADDWVVFHINAGLDALRQLVVSLPPKTGILLDGFVGRTSHMADVVRKANIPTRFAESTDGPQK